MRFKLLYLAPEILKISHTVQGVLETKKFERVRMHGIPFWGMNEETMGRILHEGEPEED